MVDLILCTILLYAQSSVIISDNLDFLLLNKIFGLLLNILLLVLVAPGAQFLLAVKVKIRYSFA